MISILPSISAGFIAVLIGFTSSAAIVFEAARAAGADQAELASWMLALGIAMGSTCIGLSLRYRKPVVTAWSTPGAALLATSLAGVGMDRAIGAFMFCAALILLSGLTGWFERIMNRIPHGIGAAMLAGVLARFGMDVFVSMQTNFVLVFLMFLAYLGARRLWPRYAVLVVLAVGLQVAGMQGLLHFQGFHFALARPVFVAPSFHLATLIGVGIPLFVVTMASQNVPGVTVMRACGYEVPISPLMSWTGAVNLLLAPFGCFAVNLAAITAAICMGREAHEDPAQRYIASVAAGVCYLLIGVFGATVAALFAAFPHELILAIAGLALLGTIAGGLATAMKDEKHRDASLVTFLVTLSGVSLFGVGAAFWGLIAGALAMAIQGLGPRR